MRKAAIFLLLVSLSGFVCNKATEDLVRGIFYNSKGSVVVNNNAIQSTRCINPKIVEGHDIVEHLLCNYSAETEEDIFYCVLPIISVSPSSADWRNYLTKNLELDSLATDTIPAGRYTVIVRFTIDTTGKITDVTVISDPGFSLGQKAADVIGRYPENWSVESYKGIPQKAYRKQAVTFVIEEDDEECKPSKPDEVIL